MKCRKDDMFDLKYNHIKYAHCKYVNKCKVTCKSYMLSLCLVGLLFRCACCPIVKYLFFIFLFIQGSMSRNPPSMIAYILCTHCYVHVISIVVVIISITIIIIVIGTRRNYTIITTFIISSQLSHRRHNNHTSDSDSGSNSSRIKINYLDLKATSSSVLS